MKKEIKITLIILGICLLIVGIIGGIAVGLNYNKNENLNIVNNTNKVDGTIKGIDDIYNLEITKNYINIKELDENYTTEQAQKDNCFVIGAMVHNDYLYAEFIDNYKKKEDAFIRVIQTTVERDIFIIDLLYDSNTDKVYMVKDDTRDKFSSAEDRTIKYKVYEKTGEWNYQNNEYWVVYNKELPDSSMYEYTINSDELFIIASFGGSSTTEKEFIAEIIEATENNIIVRPTDGSEELKSSDKISIGIIRPTNGTNDFYVVGNKVKITYDGTILESYPAIVKAKDIKLVTE